MVGPSVSNYGYDEQAFKVTRHRFIEFVHAEDAARVSDIGFDLSLIHTALAGGMDGMKISLRMRELFPD